jgi:hypothetical protein
MDQKRQKVLGDHVLAKRKLVPKFLHMLGDRYKPYSWMRQLVPEAIWIALIIDRFGFRRAIELCTALVADVVTSEVRIDKPPLIRFSSFSELSNECKVKVLHRLDKRILSEIADALSPLSQIAPSHPLAFLQMAAAKSSKESERLQFVLSEVYNRNSRLAVLSMALGEWLGIEQGKIKVAGHLAEKYRFSLVDIVDYPNTEASEKAAGFYRASAFMIFSVPLSEAGNNLAASDWVQDFWDCVAGFGDCIVSDTIKDEELTGGDPEDVFLIGLCNAVREDLRIRIASLPLNLGHVEQFEVVGALLSRQAALTIDLISSPTIWNPNSAPVLLRAMADVFISLSWIIGDPQVRSQKFVDDGLGAIKLQIAHVEQQLKTETDQEEIQSLQQVKGMWRQWLDSQRIDQFVEVNLGSWSGLNTRKMAEEAGCIDFYNYVYQPFSWAAHSNWAHISMHNSAHCLNPAHGLHRSAALPIYSPQLYWVYLAIKHFTKLLNCFDNCYSTDSKKQHARDFFEDNTEAQHVAPPTAPLT